MTQEVQRMLRKTVVKDNDETSQSASLTILDSEHFVDEALVGQLG